MALSTTVAQLTLGPVLFNWPADAWRDFYFRIADEACVDTVYVGEVVCSKRTPLFHDLYAVVADRLARSGKRVLFSTLSEVLIPRDRRAVADLCGTSDTLVEVNEASAFAALDGRAHAIGPYFNAYNERTLAVLADQGAMHVTLPAELKAENVARMASQAAQHGLTVETLVYGRISLAFSARCYHARAHGRVKDNCEFVCDRDPDGMVLRTLEEQPFLAVNGTQTLSYRCLNLLPDLAALRMDGVSAFRLSPHSHDMVAVAQVFRDALDDRIDAATGTARLQALAPELPFCNGFYHGAPGHTWG
jgi:collagenase-like PrtC family protease